MSDEVQEIDPEEDKRSRQFEVKRRMLRRAISEGRGPQALAALCRIYNNTRMTLEASDDDLWRRLSHMASDGKVTRSLEEIQTLPTYGTSRYVQAFNLANFLAGQEFRLQESGPEASTIVAPHLTLQ